jgi:hypothetical protein
MINTLILTYDMTRLNTRLSFNGYKFNEGAYFWVIWSDYCDSIKYANSRDTLTGSHCSQK